MSSNRFLAPTMAGQSSRNFSLANTGRRVSSWELKGNEFASRVNDQKTPSALQGRLEENLVFELDEFGQTQYHHMSVRALYKYVLAAITKPLHPPKETQLLSLRVSGSGGDDKDAKNMTATSTVSVGEQEKQVSFDPFAVDDRRAAILQAEAAAAARLIEHEGDISYRERLGGWLHPRDMRRLVTPFSASNEPGIIVRRHVMLLNFDPLRAIILRNCLLVLVPEGADSILIQLERRIRGGSMEVENSIFGSECGDGSGEDELASAEGSSSYKALLEKEKDKKPGGMDNVASKGSPHGSSRSSNLDESTQGKKTTKRNGSTRHDTDAATSVAESDTNSEWDEMQANDWTDLPFELQAADSVLYVVCSILSQDAYQLQEDTLGYIHEILNSHSGLQDDPLNSIRHIKDSVREMSSRIKGFVQSMNRVLDDDEDMALMNLSRLRTHPHRFLKPVTKEILDEEADEPELIMEAHLQIGLTLQNALDLIQGQIDTASELVDQKLDASRNRLLFTNMVLNLLTLCVTMGTFIVGAFGMNLTNFYENSPFAFGQIVWGTTGGMMLCLVLMLGGLVWLGIVPRAIFHV
ncbi:hypothetical protein MPSEU_000571200 [Mayamaea pseudoterrestris]|nr:hypothetical protein MPSEU_000571200 [Mayamaea pseudoterrestris]